MGTSMRAASPECIHMLQEEGGGDMKEVTRQLYMHPGYTLNQEEHEQLLLDAGKMTAILDGKQVSLLARLKLLQQSSKGLAIAG